MLWFFVCLFVCFSQLLHLFAKHRDTLLFDTIVFSVFEENEPFSPLMCWDLFHSSFKISPVFPNPFLFLFFLPQAKCIRRIHDHPETIKSSFWDETLWLEFHSYLPFWSEEEVLLQRFCLKTFHQHCLLQKKVYSPLCAPVAPKYPTKTSISLYVSSLGSGHTCSKQAKVPICCGRALILATSQTSLGNLVWSHGCRCGLKPSSLGEEPCSCIV